MSISFLSLLLVRNGNYANGDGPLKEKCWHLPSFLPPKYTHTHDAHTIQQTLFWPSLFGLSLLAVSQAYFNNCSHIPCASSFLLSILAHLSQTGQLLRQEDRMLSAIVTNNIGLSNFKTKRTEEVEVVVFEEKCALMSCFYQCHLSIFSHFKCTVVTQNEWHFLLQRHGQFSDGLVQRKLFRCIFFKFLCPQSQGN